MSTYDETTCRTEPSFDLCEMKRVSFTHEVSFAAGPRQGSGTKTPRKIRGKQIDGIIGASSAMRALCKKIQIVAPTNSTVLILGETGAGKELVARAIHELSARLEHPYIKVNCASIPKELFESEFFGHVRGAFTGAIRDRIGRFEAAQGGTLFLDEIGEVPLELQSKLLRALQEKQFERVGEERTKQADVRIVAATNRCLAKDVQAGRFREDLFYRLNVFPLPVPSLRERREDIPSLAHHFVKTLAAELHCPEPRLTEAGIIRLQSYHWPGNVRELRNVIERATVFAAGEALEFDLPLSNEVTAPALPQQGTFGGPTPEFLTEPEIQLKIRENLQAVLQKTAWRIRGPQGAAELLGLKPTTLVSRIKKLGLQKLCPSPIPLV
jgi:transcriptional regulator with GAF, ATPase, and Fis domain